MELHLAHLERSGVAVPHEIPDQAAVVAHRFGALAVGNSGSLHDGIVISHVVDKAYKPIVQYWKGLAQDIIQFRYPGALEAVFGVTHLKPPGGYKMERVF
jgi:hypothetical protein